MYAIRSYYDHAENFNNNRPPIIAVRLKKNQTKECLISTGLGLAIWVLFVYFSSVSDFASIFFPTLILV